MLFGCVLRLLCDGGSTEMTKGEKGLAALQVKNANSFVLLISAATGYRGFDRAPDLSAKQILEKCLAPLNAVANTDYASLRKRTLRFQRATTTSAECACSSVWRWAFEVDLHVPGTNLQRFRERVDNLTFVERKPPARTSNPFTTPEPVPTPPRSSSASPRSRKRTCSGSTTISTSSRVT
jgi:hypothetical protein